MSKKSDIIYLFNSYLENIDTIERNFKDIADAILSLAFDYRDSIEILNLQNKDFKNLDELKKAVEDSLKEFKEI